MFQRYFLSPVSRLRYIEKSRLEKKRKREQRQNLGPPVVVVDESSYESAIFVPAYSPIMLLDEVAMFYEDQIETEADIKITCCEERPAKDIIGFCDDCKEFFCRECVVNHVGDTTLKLENYCEERKNDLLDQISTEALIARLKLKRNELVMAQKKQCEKHKKDNEMVVLKTAIMGENKTKIYEEELERLEGVVKYLVGLEEEASTVTLKKACKKSLKNFGLEDEIKKEFKSLEKDVENMEWRMTVAKRCMNNLNEEIQVLNYFKGDEEYEFNEEKWRTFLLLNEKTPLFTPFDYYINTTIDKFRAFTSVEKAFNIEGVMKKRLVDVGQRVEMTDPLTVKKNLLTGGDVLASLSHKGILAIYTHDNITIQFTNLLNDKQVKMNVEH